MRVERLEATGILAFLVGAAVFAALAWSVQASAPIVLTDAHVTRWMVDHRSDAVTYFMNGVSALHSPGAVALWTAAFGAWLLHRRDHYWLLTLALAVGGGMLVNQGLKLLYRRARPVLDEPLVMLHSFSFPSGHTAAATALYGVLAAYFVYKVHTPVQRGAVIGAALAMIFLVAFSRVYLGAHYASDVIAAACSSGAWLIGCLLAIHAVVRKRMDGR